MISLHSLLLFTHLIGLSLAVGAATVKLMLLIRCRADLTLTPFYLKVVRLISKQIILGTILLTLSGIGWFFIGYHLTVVLMVKLVLVAAIWVLGPVIDNVVEPRFRKLVPVAGENTSSDFISIQKQYLLLETSATSLFYIIIVMWVLI
jgi:hypothetical protein